MKIPVNHRRRLNRDEGADELAQLATKLPHVLLEFTYLTRRLGPDCKPGPFCGELGQIGLRGVEQTTQSASPGSSSTSSPSLDPADQT